MMSQQRARLARVGPRPARCLLALAAGALLAAAVAAGDSAPAAKPAPGTSRQGALEQFRRLGPAERLRLLEKAGLARKGFEKVTRGPVTVTVVERGTLEPAESSEVVCRVKARGTATAAGTIKWVIDDGTEVKKGQKLVEIDDSGLREEMKTQKVSLDQAEAESRNAEEAVKTAQKEGKIAERLAAIDLRLEELEYKKYHGSDRDEKERLELRVERAGLRLQRERASAKSREQIARALAQVKAGLLLAEKSRRRDLEEALATYVIRAPRDGIASYYVPENRLGTQAIVAQGEPVKEGQKLLRVSDLRRMVVKVRVHEAQISLVRPGQLAVARVDAFPGRERAARVMQVAPVAEQQDFFAYDVKVYPVVLSLTDKLPGLKPGMSAGVRIVAEHRVGVPRVPLQSVLGAGGKRYCFVKGAGGVQEREVVTGLANDSVVEVKAGLAEGELVLRSPRVAAARVARRAGRSATPAAGKQQSRKPGPARILVRSVKPRDGSGNPRRSWVAAYGLTRADRDRIAALPAAREVVPVRAFPQEARHLQRKHLVEVFGTTPAYATVSGLEPAEGRFLAEEDGIHMRNVAVLGPAVAGWLLPGREPLGRSIILNKQSFVVVGILHEQGGPADGRVYVPLPTVTARFGERVITVRAGSRSAEVVALTEILVTVRDPQDVQDTADEVRDLLREAHRRPDWAVQVVPAS
jgi:RND family efflux transporter MFP subunit